MHNINNKNSSVTKITTTEKYYLGSATAKIAATAAATKISTPAKRYLQQKYQ